MVQAHHGVAGEVADDALESKIAELSELELLVSYIQACGSQLLSAVSQLQDAPLPLMKQLGQLYTKDSACGVLLSRLSDDLKACKFRFGGITQNLAGLAELVEQVQPRIASAKGAVAARRAAWTAKTRAEQESDPAVDRHEAGALFDMATREATFALDSLLSQRWAITGTAVTRFCGCYDELLKIPPEVVSELRKRPATESRASSEDRRRSWAGSSSRTCGTLGCFGESRKSLDGLNDSMALKSSASTGDTVTPPSATATLPCATETPPCATETPPSAEGSRDSCATEDNQILQGVYEGNAWLSLNNGLHHAADDNAQEPQPASTTSTATFHDERWCADPDPVSAPPSPPLWTMPHVEEQPGEKKFTKGDRVRVWSASKKKWLEGVVRNVFRSPGTWDSYTVPAGVIQVESSIGVKFIPPEDAKQWVQPQPVEKVPLHRGMSMSL